MKRLFSLAVALIICLASFSQTPTNLYIRGDTINLRRDGRNAVTLIDSSALISKYLQVGGPKNLANTYKNNSHLVIGDSATTKGLIIPRVQTTAAITDPKQGMVVYSISDSKFYYRTLTAWVGPSEGEIAIHETVAALKAAAINETGAIVLGLVTADDGAGGEYEYDIESSATGDDYLVVDPAPSGTGRYLKIFKGGKVRSVELKIKADGTNQKAQIDIAAALSTVQEIVFSESNTTTVIAGKVTFPANKAIRFEGNPLIGGDGGSNDTLDLNGSIIIADRAKQIFATNLVVLNAGNVDIPFKWFGAIANSSTDNLAIFQRAINSAKYAARYEIAANVDNEGVTHEDPNFYFSAGWTITKKVEIYGSGMWKTVLTFPNSAGITMGAGTTGSYLHDFRIKGRIAGYSPVGFNSYTKHGLINNGQNTFERLWIEAFDGDNFHTSGNTGLGTNANNSRYINCTAAWSGRFGFMFIGPDANNCYIYNCDATLNKRWGFKDESFLGNVYVACHAASNGVGESSTAGSPTLTHVRHNDIVWLATVSQGGNKVSHGGNRYQSLLNTFGEPNVGITPPNATYWTALGAGGTSSEFPAWQSTKEYPSQNAIEPGVGAGWENVWFYGGVDVGASGWTADTSYYTGSGYSMPGLNQQGVYLGCYAEGDQQWIENSQNFISGGFLAAHGQAHGAIGLRSGILTSKTTYQVLDGTREVGIMLSGSLGTSGNNQEFMGFHDEINNLYVGAHYNQTNKTFSIGENGISEAFNVFPNSQATPATFGRTTLGAISPVTFLNGLWLHNGTKYLNFSSATTLPSTTTAAIGDIKFYNGTSTSILFYKCTDTTGASDTWITVTSGAVDADVVHITGTETITGVKTFTSPFAVRSAVTGNNIASLDAVGSPAYNTILHLYGREAGASSGAVFYDGPDPSNAAYAAFNIATSGGYFGTSGYAVFASSKNGTGTQLPMTFGGWNGSSFIHWLTLSTAGVIGFPVTPTTSAGTYDILTRNTSNGNVEKIASSVVAPAARTITINGTTQDLSANRTYTIDGVFTTTTFATTNATPTNVITYGTATNERGVIEVTLTGVKSNGDGITGKKIVAYKNIAGTLTLGTITEDLATVADGDLSTAVWTISVSGTNIIVVFTGVAATVIDGTTSHKITKVIPAS